MLLNPPVAPHLLELRLDSLVEQTFFFLLLRKKIVKASLQTRVGNLRSLSCTQLVRHSSLPLKFAYHSFWKISVLPSHHAQVPQLVYTLSLPINILGSVSQFYLLALNSVTKIVKFSTDTSVFSFNMAACYKRQTSRMVSEELTDP